MYRKLIALFFIGFVLTSCNSNNGDGSPMDSSGPLGGVLPGSNGGRLDIIVVAKDHIWDGVAGNQLRKYIIAPQYGLPQPEPLFTVRQVAPKEFNELLKRSRNLIILEEDSITGYQIQSNKWAKPQLVASFVANDQPSLAKLIKEKQEELIKKLYVQELTVLQSRVTAGHQPNPEVLENHLVKMKLPPAFEVEIEQENLLVFWNKTVKTDQGIIIHFEPLNREENLLGSDIFSLRDSITKLYIPGETKGSYMQIETMDGYAPKMEPMEIEGRFAFETRGLWKTVGEYKGGPFISYTIYDEKNNQKVTLDAFIYAPEIKKRNMVLELEAILKTVEFIN